jgi:hypothetical protein
MMTKIADNANAPARSEAVAIPRSTLDKLLRHAAFAAHLVGHLDDDARAALIHQLGDHVDAIVHELTELLGNPQAIVAPEAFAPDHETSDDTQIVTSNAGGAL